MSDGGLPPQQQELQAEAAAAAAAATAAASDCPQQPFAPVAPAPAPPPAPPAATAGVVAPAPPLLAPPIPPSAPATDDFMERDAKLAAALQSFNADRPRRAAAEAAKAAAAAAAAGGDDDGGDGGESGRSRRAPRAPSATAAGPKKRGRPRKNPEDGTTAAAKRRAPAGAKKAKKGPRKTVSVINANGTRSGRRISKRELAEGESDTDEVDDDGEDGYLDDDDEYGARAEAASARRAVDAIPAFAGEPGSAFPLSELDDEVERVLGHREMSPEQVAEADEAAAEVGLPTPSSLKASGDAWATAEFRVKWRRYSYLHTSWDTRATLSQLPGYKRVLNYCKRHEELEAARPGMTREQIEYADVQLAMEEEEVEEASRVERVLKSADVVPLSSDEGQADEIPEEERPASRDDTRKLLVKWRGLPYCECTWEFESDVAGAQGGAEAIEAFERREARLRDEKTLTVDEARARFFSTASLGGGGGATASAAGGNAGRAMVVQPGYLQRGTLRDYQLQGLNWLVYSWSRNENCILADEMGLGKTVQCVSMLGYLRDELLVGGPFLVVVPLSTIPNWAHELGKWLPSANSVVYVGDTKSREVIRRFEFGEGFSGPTGGAGAGGGRRKGAAAASSSLARRSTLRPPRTTRFDVLVTTYELVLKDAAVLSKVKWNYLVVDEAHRLKNSEAALYKGLSQMRFRNKLLVTGTPLQNSLRELWALLHFLDPDKFPDHAEFEREYEVKEAEQVLKLHEQLRPHLLRRVIKDVERSLPPKNERILRVGMTPLQKRYYRWILTRNFRDLNRGARGGAQVSLLNIITELKKCCNHPFLFESAEAEYRLKAGAAAAARTAGARQEAEAKLSKARADAAEAAVSFGEGHESTAAARRAERDAEEEVARVDADAALEAQREEADRLVLTSGKMVLLDKLLRRLKETGHRVLIFSQMVRVLDIIADYCKLRGFLYQRLDGSTPAAARHQAMDHFNAPDSRDFVFLLSTRAGGLGINLATADTVIIFDSDWNPQNDFQAMSRAHRIGQKDTVNIYRFLTSGSCEEDILERAKRKMVLDHLVIQRMDTSGRGAGGASSEKAPSSLHHDPGHAASAKAILAGAAAANSTKEFSKDEMAAILRFGAEEIFKEDDAAREARQRQLVEEDIDAILARAEVIDTSGLGGATAAGDPACAELLNSFNVASFESKVAEDDAAFWDRIVSKDERPSEAAVAAGAGGPEIGPDGRPVELGVRAARLKALDAETIYREIGGGGGGGKKTPYGRLRASSATPSDDEGAGGKFAGSEFVPLEGGGNPPGCTRRRFFATSTAGPGPPLSDAALRVDGWPAPCGSIDESAPRPPRGQWPDTMSRRDAGLFVRAARRFALPHRLDEITAEVGDAFGRKYSKEARLALLSGLKNACLAAYKRGGADANLDWFGATVKAEDIGGHLLRMEKLHEEFEALGGDAGGRLEREFSVDWISEEVDCPPPKWASKCGWDSKDDAALLVGVYRHGWQRWAAIADDPRLVRLKEKFAQAAQEKLAKEPHNAPGLEHLPRGTHLETRVIGLLKRMVKAREAQKKRLERDGARGAALAAKRAAAKGGGGGGGDEKATPPRSPPLDPSSINLSESLQRTVDDLLALRAEGHGPRSEQVAPALRRLGAQVRARAGGVGGGGGGEAGVWSLVAAKMRPAAGGEGGGDGAAAAPEPEAGWSGPELAARFRELTGGVLGDGGGGESAAAAAANAASMLTAAAATAAASKASPAPAAKEEEEEKPPPPAPEEVEMKEADADDAAGAKEEEEGKPAVAPPAAAAEEQLPVKMDADGVGAAPATAAAEAAAPPPATTTTERPENDGDDA